ncbi:MAG: rod shape-determining protein MreC [Patescibacteria group bacterium]
MSQSRKSSFKNWRLILLVFVCIFILWLLVSWVRKYRATVVPIYGDAISLSTYSKQSLLKKVIALQSELDAKNASLVSLSTLEKENESIKAELEREGAIKGTLARVVVPPNRSIYDTLVIDIGSDENVAVGQGVYAFGSVALGTISEVLEHSSTVLLYSASNRQTSGTVTGSDLSVTLIGRGAGEYEVRMPRDIVFEQGGVISQQSLSVHPLATIEKIITDARDPFQRLLAKIPVNLQTLKWVVVK